MLGHDTEWPEPTTGISRVSLEIDAVPETGMRSLLAKRLGMGGLGVGRVILEIIDFPGEWLVDLPMLSLGFEEWSSRMLSMAASDSRRHLSSDYFNLLDSALPSDRFDEEFACKLQDSWANYLARAVESGFTLNQPGRHLRPDALANSPVLRFGPLPPTWAETKFHRGMAKRFEEYKRKVIKPFYEDHFAKIDRQIVLVDVLRALEQGEGVFDEMTRTLGDVLQSFRYGRGGLLSWLSGFHTTHVLFAATKADHVIRGDRANLRDLLRKMLALVDEGNSARSQSAKYDVLALASIKATDDRMTVSAPKREILYGRPGKETEFDQWDPGGIPLDMPPDWSNVHFEFYRFGLPRMKQAMHEGFPAINLGKALDFLIGEDFK